MAAAASCASNASPLPVCPPILHGIVTQLIFLVMGGLVGFLVVVGAQWLRDRKNKRELLHNAASMIGIELAMIADAIRHEDWIRPRTSGLYEGRAVPRGAYDRISSSGALGRLDLRTQELLYRFYWRASIGDHDAMNAMIYQVAAAVGQAARKNAPGLRAALGGGAAAGAGRRDKKRSAGRSRPR